MSGTEGQDCVGGVGEVVMEEAVPEAHQEVEVACSQLLSTHNTRKRAWTEHEKQLFSHGLVWTDG